MAGNVKRLATAVVEKMAQDLIEARRKDDCCPNCSSGRLLEDKDSGEIHCRKCGYVSPEKIEVHEDFDDEKHERTKGTGLKYAYGSSSIIDRADTDFAGRPLKGAMKSTLGRIRLLDTRSDMNSGKHRSLGRAVPLITEWAKTMGMPESAIIEATRIYTKTVSARLTRGRNLKSISAASLKIACKFYGIPRSDQKIAQVSGVKFKELTRAYITLVRFLKEAEHAGNTVTDPANFLSSIASKINLPEKTARRAAEMIEMSNKTDFSGGKKREVIAGTAIYIASMIDRTDHTQRTIAMAADITEVSIRNNYPKMLNHFGLHAWRSSAEIGAYLDRKRHELGMVHIQNELQREIRGESKETNAPIKLIKSKTKV
ncbi:MAG: hypothetical protein KGH49_02880 [Candidatus Micrarchaeota archaeon]|nr:hypothetical protein [Candidatus Micrarchaeota archaeon]